jgi:hypothetical protein
MHARYVPGGDCQDVEITAVHIWTRMGIFEGKDKDREAQSGGMNPVFIRKTLSMKPL